MSEAVAAQKAGEAAQKAGEAAQKAGEAAQKAGEAARQPLGFGDSLLASASNIFTGAVVSLVSTFPSVGGIASKITTTVKKETDRLDENVKKITNLIESKEPIVGGGGRRREKNVKKNIQKTTKRLNHLLRRFSSRRKKINYTKRLHRV